MLVIGLTGPSGAGKSEISSMFAACGLPIIDADKLYHSLLIPPSVCLNELRDEFGDEVLFPNGTLNRKALGSIVFADPQALQKLNKITHRFVMEALRAQLRSLRAEHHLAAIVDAPQLFEAGADRDCNVVVSVLADKRLRLERIMQRDGLDADAALQRINAQRSDDFFRSHSDYIIENNGSIDSLRPQIMRILLEMGVVTQ